MLHSLAPLRSIVCSLTRSLPPSRAHGKEVYVYETLCDGYPSWSLTNSRNHDHDLYAVKDEADNDDEADDIEANDDDADNDADDDAVDDDTDYDKADDNESDNDADKDEADDDDADNDANNDANDDDV